MKYNVILLLFISCVTILHAQTQDSQKEDKPSIKYGIRLGMTISNFMTKHTKFFEGEKKGFVGAVYSHIPLNKHFIFIPEISFTSKGNDQIMKVILGNKGSTKILTLREPKSLYYLEIPLNIAYNFNETLKVYLGISTSLLLYAKSNVSYEHGSSLDSPSLPKEGEHIITDWYKEIDLGLNLGLNHSFTDHVNLDIRLTNGLTDILNDGFGGKYSNRSLIFGLGYTF